jgi:hypothetical protein
MSSYDALGSDPAASYGTDANFQANYRLTQPFVNSYKAPLLNSNRIWLGGYSLYEQDMEDFDALLTSQGIPHTLGPMQDVVQLDERLAACGAGRTCSGRYQLQRLWPRHQSG